MSQIMSDVNINMPDTAFEEEVVVYKECQHNFAASLGRVCHDGCREFLQGDHKDNVVDAMLCAACGCHRSFHRIQTIYNPVIQAQPENIVNATDSLAEPFNFHVEFRTGKNSEGQMKMPVKPKRKKRTVFSAEQRKKMMEFAEKFGWKSQKGNNDEINRFCLEMGISRRMFMVWLNNNRHRAMKNATTSMI